MSTNSTQNKQYEKNNKQSKEFSNKREYNAKENQ